MWLFTSCGFFSIVQKDGEDRVTVRARVAADLDRLRDRYLPSLSNTLSGMGTDYPYRAHVTHQEFAAALTRIVQDLHYSNFKDHVKQELGPARAGSYMKVWSAMYGLEEHES